MDNLFPLPDRYRDADGIAAVVREGLCHRCGACVGLCPADTLGLDAEDYPAQIATCIHCGTCVQACSGLAVDYDAIGRHFISPEYRFGPLLGSLTAACIGHASDPEARTSSASGGVITGLLIHLLETGHIRGALVAAQDPADPSRGAGIVARTRPELLAAGQSKYTTCPSFSALRAIRKEEGPFAVVGLPCQIHALRAMQMRDERWKRKVPLAIGLYCHYNIPFRANQEAFALVTPAGARVMETHCRQRDERGWPHNTLELKFSNGTKWRSPVGPAEIFNLMSHVSRLGRCLTCMDATAEFADFSIGDPWIRGERGEWKYSDPGGWSSVIVRTPAGAKALQQAEAAGKLALRPIPPEEIEAGQRSMMSEKKRRVAFRVRVRRALGLSTPFYAVPLPAPRLTDVGKELRFWLTRLLPLFGPVRRAFLRFFLSPRGVAIIRRRSEAKRRKARGATRIKQS